MSTALELGKLAASTVDPIDVNGIKVANPLTAALNFGRKLIPATRKGKALAGVGALGAGHVGVDAARTHWGDTLTNQRKYWDQTTGTDALVDAGRQTQEIGGKLVPGAQQAMDEAMPYGTGWLGRLGRTAARPYMNASMMAHPEGDFGASDPGNYRPPTSRSTKQVQVPTPKPTEDAMGRRTTWDPNAEISGNTTDVNQRLLAKRQQYNLKDKQRADEMATAATTANNQGAQMGDDRTEFMGLMDQMGLGTGGVDAAPGTASWQETDPNAPPPAAAKPPTRGIDDYGDEELRALLEGRDASAAKRKKLMDSILHRARNMARSAIGDPTQEPPGAETAGETGGDTSGGEAARKSLEAMRRRREARERRLSRVWNAT